MGIESAAQHLGSLIHAVFNVAPVGAERHPSILRAPKKPWTPVFPEDSFVWSMIDFTSASCVEEQVYIRTAVLPQFTVAQLQRSWSRNTWTD